jgi:hypothetical protein
MKRFRSILFLLAAALLFGAASARAYLLAVEVLWTGTPPFSDNLDVGSIIQVVAYDSTGTGTTSWDHDDPTANFTPYGSDTYLADTTPDGHQIVGSGSLQALSEYGGGVYGMTTIIDVPDAYDTVYVRVFSATDFGQGVKISDVNWGISGTNHVDPTFGTALTWFDNVEAPNVANFEVIPEPSSLAFLLSGGCGMGVFAVFRRRRKLRPPEE